MANAVPAPGNGGPVPRPLRLDRRSQRHERISRTPGGCARERAWWKARRRGREPRCKTHMGFALPGEAVRPSRVLVVENNVQVAEGAASVLAEQGHTVVSGAHTSEALYVLNSGQPFDVILSDLVMPGELKGFDLAQHVPALPVLLGHGLQRLSYQGDQGGLPPDLKALQARIAPPRCRENGLGCCDLPPRRPTRAAHLLRRAADSALPLNKSAPDPENTKKPRTVVRGFFYETRDPGFCRGRARTKFSTSAMWWWGSSPQS